MSSGFGDSLNMAEIDYYIMSTSGLHMHAHISVNKLVHTQLHTISRSGCRKWANSARSGHLPATAMAG